MQIAEILMPHEVPVKPWQIEAIDLFRFDRSNFILSVDYYSKYLFVQRLYAFSNQEVINKTKQIFWEQGVTKRMISDHGPHYNSTVYKQFSKE